MSFRLPSQKAFKPNRPRPRAAAATTPKPAGGWVGPTMSRAALAAATLSPEQAEAAAAAAAAEQSQSSAGPSGTQGGGDDSGTVETHASASSQPYPSLTQAMTQSTQDTIIATPLERKGGARPAVSVRGETDESTDTPTRPRAPVFTLPPHQPMSIPRKVSASVSLRPDSVPPQSPAVASQSQHSVQPSARESGALEHPAVPSSSQPDVANPTSAKSKADKQIAPEAASGPTEAASNSVNLPIESLAPKTSAQGTARDTASADSVIVQPAREEGASASRQKESDTVASSNGAGASVKALPSIQSSISASSSAHQIPRASAPPPNRFSVPPPPRPRQASTALSTSSSTSKPGSRMNLLNAAREAAANGTSGPSPGRLPSRSRSASIQPGTNPIPSNIAGPPSLAVQPRASSPPASSANAPPIVAPAVSQEAPNITADTEETVNVVSAPIIASADSASVRSSKAAASSQLPAQNIAGLSRSPTSRAPPRSTPARSVTPVASTSQAATPLFIEPLSDNETNASEAGTPAPSKRSMTTAEAAQAILDGMTRERGTSLPAARRIGKRDKKNPGITISKRVYKDKTAKKVGLKRKSTADAEDETAGTSAEPETAEPVVKPKRKMPQRGVIVKQLRKRARKARSEDEDEDEPSDEDMYITKIVHKPRGEYQSAGLAGTDQDKRLAQNKDKRKKKEKKPAFQQADISVFEPGEVVGQDIDVNTLTMGDIATNITHGSVSARGVKLSSFAQEEKAERRRQTMQNAWDNWVNGQPARRKARRDKNLEKETRREECREAGGDPDAEVSEDEADSDEDHGVQPDRFTPPEDPERVARIQPRVFGQTIIHPTRATGVGDEEGDGDEGEDGMEGYEGFGLGEEGEEIQLEVVENTGEEEEEDELAAAGFAVAEAGDADMGYADDDDDDDEVNWEDLQQQQYGRHNYLEEREEQRQRDIEARETRVVYEEDDTLKMVNTKTFSKVQPRGAPWSAADIDTLYSALSEVGINSDIIKGYFPTRTRNQVNRKMVKEQRENPAKFWAAVDAKKQIDIEHLKVAAAYDDNDDWTAEDRFLAQCKRDAQMCRNDYVDPPEGEGGEHMDLDAFGNVPMSEREDQEVDFDNLSAYDGGEGEEGEALVGLDDDEDVVKKNEKDEDEDDD